MAKVNDKLINNLLRRRDQEQRDHVERERSRAKAARLAAIKERHLKQVLSGAVEQILKARSVRDLHVHLRPHPSNAGRKRLLSPAGEVADRGHKWAGCLPGSFETGKR
jgi:hypothetical protein